MLRPTRTLFALALFVPAVASAAPGAPPASMRTAVGPDFAVPTLALDAIDVEAELAADGPDKSGPGPLRFAVPTAVQVDPLAEGRHEVLDDGSDLYRMRFEVPDATDLNFGFRTFNLPQGATMHIIAEDGYYEGPFTGKDATEGQLWTPVIPGDVAIVEIRVPEGAKSMPDVEVSQVAGGFRDMFKKQEVLAQGSCNNDVVCPVGDPWRNEIASVGVYTLSGWWTCTGTMIMDVPGSMRNFFLTANHCGISTGNDQTMVVYWNFESPTCGRLGGGSLSNNQSGATWRASKSDVDFALVELTSDPNPGWGVTYAGWDRSNTTPNGAVGIHHPSTDEKAISFENNRLSTSNSCIGNGTSTHWTVNDWDDGTTEPGSSGSGLWDKDNHLLVGTLSGGGAACGNNQSDCYGKFARAWDSGSNASSRLRDWLDPAGLGPNTVPGSWDAGSSIAFNGFSTLDMCLEDGSLDNGVNEPGELVEITVTLQADDSFTGVSGVLTSSTPGVTVIDDTASWPNLSAGVPRTNSAPFTVQLDPAMACGAGIDFGLEVDSNQGGPFTFAFSDAVGDAPVTDTPKPLVDNGTTTSQITLSDAQTLTDLNVFVSIDHTWIGDLEIRLSHPDGTTVTLLDQPGVPASDFGCDNDNMRITFDDASSFNPESHCAGTTPWYSGSADPVGSLAAFNGKTTAGTWTLTIVDNADQDTGTLLDWSLDTTPGVGAGQCEVCGTIPPVTLTATPGTCPGPIDVDGAGLTPNGTVEAYRGTGVGSTNYAHLSCPGLVLDVAGGSLFKTLTADPDGTFGKSGNLNEGACTKAFQLLDVETCRLSNVLTF